jgi:hypothetical protein
VDIINKNLLPFRIAIGGEVSIACRNYQLMLSGFDEMKIYYSHLTLKEEITMTPINAIF